LALKEFSFAESTDAIVLGVVIAHDTATIEEGTSELGSLKLVTIPRRPSYLQNVGGNFL
jgi:hypothetical protein